ncbi:MAG: hypothetical protein J3K34DRAFT_417891 [Monoraphidium minutum]|nr:MAG: hypothetical protein J3K34DRAFT_417891 [Monoraphidium minutum]
MRVAFFSSAVRLCLPCTRACAKSRRLELAGCRHVRQRQVHQREEKASGGLKCRRRNQWRPPCEHAPSSDERAAAAPAIKPRPRPSRSASGRPRAAPAHARAHRRSGRAGRAAQLAAALGALQPHDGL